MPRISSPLHCCFLSISSFKNSWANRKKLNRVGRPMLHPGFMDTWVLGKFWKRKGLSTMSHVDSPNFGRLRRSSRSRKSQELKPQEFSLTSWSRRHRGWWPRSHPSRNRYSDLSDRRGQCGLGGHPCRCCWYARRHDRADSCPCSPCTRSHTKRHQPRSA